MVLIRGGKLTIQLPPVFAYPRLVWISIKNKHKILKDSWIRLLNLTMAPSTKYLAAKTYGKENSLQPKD